MLPQTTAFVLETFRWRPVSAGGMCIQLPPGSNSIELTDFSLGFAHKATKDIIWVGFYFFIGGDVDRFTCGCRITISSLKVPLWWEMFGTSSSPSRDWKWIPDCGSPLSYYRAVGRDPDVFPDPERFDPQRWLTEEGKIKEELKNFTFGFGRRCLLLLYFFNSLRLFSYLLATDIGCVLDNTWLLREFDLRPLKKPMSSISNPPFNSSVFINTALVQWAFNIKPDPSAPIDELAFTESANTHPLPFKVIFEPRAAQTMEGVRELMEDYGLWYQWFIYLSILGLHPLIYFWIDITYTTHTHTIHSYLTFATHFGLVHQPM